MAPVFVEFESDEIAESHLGDGSSHAATTDGLGGNDCLIGCYPLVEQVVVVAQDVEMRHLIITLDDREEEDTMTRPFEFGRADISGILYGYTYGDKCRRNMDVFKSS